MEHSDSFLFFHQLWTLRFALGQSQLKKFFWSELLAFELVLFQIEILDGQAPDPSLVELKNEN